MAENFHRFLYGGDYNPDQWLEYPDILKEDIRMMKEAHINTVTLGVFAWSKLEPQDGVYDFDWMEEIIDRLYENGIYVNPCHAFRSASALAGGQISGGAAGGRVQKETDIRAAS